MTVSVLSSIAANATNDNVRLDALRTMPQLLEQKNYQQQLKPFLVRSISSLIPSVTEVEVLRRQLMLDIQTLVEADESYRKALITELTGSDRSWSFINNKSGGNPDPKQIRVGLQIKLALLSLVQDYRRAQDIAAGLVDLARRSPELSKFVSDQLDSSMVLSPRTALRVIARSAVQSLNGGIHCLDQLTNNAKAYLLSSSWLRMNPSKWRARNWLRRSGKAESTLWVLMLSVLLKMLN